MNAADKSCRLNKKQYQTTKTVIKMKKTILTLTTMLVMVISAIATPVSGAHMALKGDSVVVTDGDKSVAVSSMDLQRVNEKIREALDDTLTTGGTTVEIGDRKGELMPEDIKAISADWASVVKQITINGSLCLLGLVALVLLFRFLNRRNKYRVIERAIENNYPLNELSLGDVKRSAIYVQQPVVTQVPPVQQAGQVPVGTPIEGQTPQQPIVMTGMVNWRALMPAVKWIGWGVLLVLFSVAIGDFENPFWPIGLALIFVGVCKGYILYKEQKALQQAWNKSQNEPMREGIPVPPAFNNNPGDGTNNQPY